MSDTEVLKNLDVVLRSIASFRLTRWCICRSHESDKLIRYYPIQISILHLFVVFILFIIKVTEAVPA
jgi:hypothetical protein